MVSTGKITRISAALLVMLVASGPAFAADNPNGYYMRNSQTLEQDVEGDGYSMVYQKVNTKTLQFKNYMHGSGKMDAAILLSSNQSTSGANSQDQNTLVYGPYVTTYNSDISFLEQNEMTYSPMAMVYGTGWYEKNPIVYNSKLKERTEAKNYDGSGCNPNNNSVGVSMLHQIEYASAFKKDIEVKLENSERLLPSSYDKGKATSRYTSSAKAGYSNTSMRIEEEVVEGAVHIGQLLTRSDKGWKEPLIEIDENYHGTFRIKKEMEICTTCTGSKPREDWLSCCIGGYDNIHDDDRMWGEKEVFDCTCRDVAWGKAWNDTSKAQYCRDCE